MKTTKSKPVKCTKIAAKEAKPHFPVKSGKPPKGGPRIIGCGTHQKKEHAPRVV